MGKRINLAFAQAADKILDAVRDSPQPLQTYLRGGAFYGVNGAEKFVDLFRTVIRFEREQAIADDLQMFFGFGLEEFQNFRGDFVVLRQGVEIGTGNRGDGRGVFRAFCEVLSRGVGILLRGGLRRKSKTIAFLERGDVFENFLSRVADFQ